jgi:hypothetical protein
MDILSPNRVSNELTPEVPRDRKKNQEKLLTVTG